MGGALPPQPLPDRLPLRVRPVAIGRPWLLRADGRRLRRVQRGREDFATPPPPGWQRPAAQSLEREISPERESERDFLVGGGLDVWFGGYIGRSLLPASVERLRGGGSLSGDSSADVGRTSPNPSRARPISRDVGQCWCDFDHFRGGAGQLWGEVEARASGASSACFRWLRPKCRRMCPMVELCFVWPSLKR